MIVYLSLLVCVLGALVYGLSKNNPKVEEMGRLAFACGLLAFLLTGVSHLLTVVK